MDTSKPSSRPIAIWLLTGVFMIFVQIILGGITRLTDSGLSITEWKPLLGIIPPMNNKEWNEAFDRYKQLAQFKDLHFYFTLEDFKTIYFWEWLHRVWGRFLGIVFLVPFVIFLLQKRFRKEMIKPMIILFLLGALQGFIGWIMVKSGLNNEDLYVSHFRLAIHFIAALGLLVYTFWFALRVLVKPEQRIYNLSSKKWLLLIIVLLIIQSIYGAFMAGLKAATTAPTWPAINGDYLPDIKSHAGQSFSFISALFNNPIAIHFVHRSLAYLIFFLIILWTVKIIKEKTPSVFNLIKWWPLIFVCTQLILGIAAVLTSPKKITQRWSSFEWSAQLHQVTAIFLIISLVMAFYLSSAKEKSKFTGGFDKDII